MKIRKRVYWLWKGILLYIYLYIYKSITFPIAYIYTFESVNELEGLGGGVERPIGSAIEP